MGWITKLVGFALPSWSLYAILAAAFAGAMGWSWLEGKGYAEAMIQGAKLEATVIAAVQQTRTDAQIVTWKKLKEAVDEKAKAQDALRASQLAAADKRVLDALSKAGSRTRIVPAPASSSASDKRICFPDRDALDREISAGIAGAFGRYAPKRIASAEEGQHAVDVSVLCRDWTRALPK